MKRLRVAGVGAGYFSQFHLDGWRAIADRPSSWVVRSRLVKLASVAGAEFPLHERRCWTRRDPTSSTS